MKLCSYGCGKRSKYYFKYSRTWCCSRHYSMCPKMRENNPMKREKVKNKFRGINSSAKRLEVREKLRISATKQMSIKENRDKISGLNNYKGGKSHLEVFGRKRSEEIAKKIRRKFVGKTYEEIYSSIDTVKERKETLRENFVKNNPMKLQEVIEKVSGKNHHNWNPNREEVFSPYTEKFFNKEFRTSICKEQNFICPICRNVLGSYRPTLHHINYKKNDDSRLNLVVVHNGCNVKVNKNRKNWIEMLTSFNGELKDV